MVTYDQLHFEATLCESTRECLYLIRRLKLDRDSDVSAAELTRTLRAIELSLTAGLSLYERAARGEAS